MLVAEGVIDEVLGRLKSGKEADISLVRRGDSVLVAKVYKDRSTRSFKNNVEYKEGRKVRNTRTQRAMDTGGKFGRDAAEQAWKSAEADALYKLAGSGVRAPAPVMFFEGVLLMELVCDAEGRPAPRLEELTLERESVLGIYCDLLAQLISMLCCDLIHGDLSPYNILLAADGPVIIDFPQVISAAHNSRAEHFFLRDFDNVHGFLTSFDPSLAPHRSDGRSIWHAYVRRELTPQFVPPPPPPPRSAPRTERTGRPPEARRMQPGGRERERERERSGAGAGGPPPLVPEPMDRPRPRLALGTARSPTDQRTEAERAYARRVREPRAAEARAIAPEPTEQAPTVPAPLGGRPAELRPKYPNAGAPSDARPDRGRGRDGGPGSGRDRDRGGSGRDRDRGGSGPRSPQSRPSTGQQPTALRPSSPRPPPQQPNPQASRPFDASALPRSGDASAGPPRRRRRRR